MKCNLCGNKKFVDMNSRKNVRCAKCGSLERTRLIWLYLQRMGISKKHKVLHIAPEKGLFYALSNILGEEKYIVADIDPSKYSFAKNCKKIDLCELDQEAPSEYDFIIHMHVLEHTPCNIAYTLFHLHRMLSENGRHVFVVPFMGGRYDESFQKISDEERVRRFGQNDHVRRFGKEDVARHLGKVIDLPDEFDATVDFNAHDLSEANIPESYWKGLHSGTVFILRKNDFKFFDYS